MGAILAILGEAGDPELAERLQRMLARSPHRGELEFLVEGPIAIGIQSLGWDASLADDGNWLVAFHGYVGNWKELAAERGWRFADGASNAGKIAVAYEDLGDRLFAKVRGEWAVLIWNRRERTLLVARDVVGCRPLFTHRHGSRFFLATEARQVLAGSGAEARCNPGAAADFHLLRFPKEGRTLFQGVDIFPGGVVRVLGREGPGSKPRDLEFWRPPPVDQRRRDPRELVDELRWLLNTAVRRAAPKTGAGVTLSGGMDSTSVWATLSSLVSSDALRSGKFRPYSNVYPGLPCDESTYIKSIHAFTGVDGVLVDSTVIRASELLDALCRRLGQPHLPNALPVELVCEAAAANGHSTLLTGLGGDEWLGGSLDYIRELFYSGRVFTALRDLWRVRLPTNLDGFRSRASWLSPGLGLATRFGLGRHTTGGMQGVVAPEHRGGTASVRGSWQERVEGQALPPSKRALVGNLDRLVAGSVLEVIEGQGAWHGVELRHPLMDVDIMNFGFSVASRALVAGRCHKWLLRESMADRLPADVTGRIETTEFSCLFSREVDLLGQLPRGGEWDLVRLGVLDGETIDRYLTEPYSWGVTFDMVRLWWLETFVHRNFARDGVVDLIKHG